MYYYVLEMDILYLLKKVAILSVLCLCTSLLHFFISYPKLDPWPNRDTLPFFLYIFTCGTQFAIYLSECKHIEVPSKIVEYCL